LRGQTLNNRAALFFNEYVAMDQKFLAQTQGVLAAASSILVCKFFKPLSRQDKIP
jgi:hypothetical protein